MSAGSSSFERLSKSRYRDGLQCQKMLWWKVHEPNAPELVVGPEQQETFDQGNRVGEIAREYVAGGVLIDLPYRDFEGKVAATAKALADGAPAIYEASFIEDDIFAAVDILERRRGGFNLIEVKSTTKVKDEYIPDVAVQMHVVRRAGLEVKRAEVMHLNRECRYPDLSNLFVRKNVTSLTGPALRAVPGEARAMLAALAGPLPQVAIGPHCTKPYECVFRKRCWPALPEHHVSTLYQIRSKKVEKLVADGCETLLDLPRNYEASGPAKRQIRSARSGKVVVERGLRRALVALKPPIAFLDFETVGPAVPVWPGCGPYQAVPVQFSCHQGLAGADHHEWLADGPDDPREELARALIAACAGAKTVLAYSASFERGCIKGLIEALPHLEAALTALSGKIRDLYPIVRDHVYHPGFAGGFGLKEVLPALVPELGYEDLGIQGGNSASAALERLLFEGEALSAAERKALRRDLLQYCERDTLAMVRIYEKLGELARR